MRRNELDDLLAKLRPISRDLADSLWMASVLDPQRQSDISAVARAAAAEALGETYGEEGVLLELPDERVPIRFIGRVACNVNRPGWRPYLLTTESMPLTKLADSFGGGIAASLDPSSGSRRWLLRCPVRWLDAPARS